MKKLILTFLTTIMVLGVLFFINKNIIFQEENKLSDFKVVGYYSGDLFNEPVEKLHYGAT